MKTTRAEFDVVIRARQLRAAAQGRTRRPHVRLLKDWSQVGDHDPRDLYVVLTRAELLNESELEHARRKRTAGEKRFLVLPDDTPLELLLEKIFKLNVRSAQRIHTPRLPTGDVEAFLKRFLAALGGSEGRTGIIDAWWEGDRFVVLSPMFERLHVPVDAVSKLRHADEQERQRFQIDEHGEYVYWPDLDLHVGWEQFRQAIDPQARLEAQKRSRAFDERYGEAVRMLRQATGLTQTQIPGLDARTVRRIEQGQTRLTSNAIRKLAAAHQMAPNQYLSAVLQQLEQQKAAG